ncbi:hypothetical protein C8Q75DRAFT_182259 [Abortiporus biennis]|nr:hypothetical protein C8Q75DRAFT_182259 [Abortiporus biennis]
MAQVAVQQRRVTNGIIKNRKVGFVLRGRWWKGGRWTSWQGKTPARVDGLNPSLPAEPKAERTQSSSAVVSLSVVHRPRDLLRDLYGTQPSVCAAGIKVASENRHPPPRIVFSARRGTSCRDDNDKQLKLVILNLRNTRGIDFAFAFSLLFPSPPPPPNLQLSTSKISGSFQIILASPHLSDHLVLDGHPSTFLKLLPPFQYSTQPPENTNLFTVS